MICFFLLPFYRFEFQTVLANVACYRSIKQFLLQFNTCSDSTELTCFYGGCKTPCKRIDNNVAFARIHADGKDMDTWDQMCYVAERLIGRRLTYWELTEDNGRESGANDGETMRRKWEMIREDEDYYDVGYKSRVDAFFHKGELDINEHEELTLFD